MERTSAYRFTVTSKDDPRLVELRKEVAAHNKRIPWSEPNVVQWRPKGTLWCSRKVLTVNLRGRLGKDNPNIDKYRTRSGRLDTQTVHHEDAVRFDVYVHERYIEKRDEASEVFVANLPPPKVKSATELLFEEAERNLRVIEEEVFVLRRTVLYLKRSIEG